MRSIGHTYYDAVARDTIAMIVNDVIVVGAEPQVVTAYWEWRRRWFDDRGRAADLVRGWTEACTGSAPRGAAARRRRCRIITPGTIDLGGACAHDRQGTLVSATACTGRCDRARASSGIHANGLTLARALADRLPQGYAKDIGTGMAYGDALLAPTVLYPPLVRALFEAGVDVHYLANVTGHGWRKLMRARRELRYVLHTVPPAPPLFAFMTREAGLDAAEAYATFNMGAGFAIYVPEPDAQRRRRRYALRAAARIARLVAPDQEVVIEPLSVRYAGKTSRCEADASSWTHEMICVREAEV
jgi:phosphoribosylformylglycinamidine cyclo-ligase